MTPTEALQAVYDKGVECEGCPWHYRVLEVEQLSGRNTNTHGVRGCSIIDSQNYHFAHDPADCPGVEGELNKENENEGKQSV